MSRQTAKVLDAGRECHPESNKECMMIQVARPWAVGGERWPSTLVWAEAAAPQPEPAEVIGWGEHHVWIRGVRYRKPEDDSNPAAPLH